MFKKIVTSSAFALAMTVVVPFGAYGQAQPNPPPTAISPPSTQPPTSAAPANPTTEQRATPRQALPNTASAWPFIALGAIVAVALAAAIRIGVDSID